MSSWSRRSTRSSRRTPTSMNTRSRCSRTAAAASATKGKDNGLLVVLAVKDRRVRAEVGYDLEQFITDGFAGEVSRNDMAPYFARGEYGPGCRPASTRIIGRDCARPRRHAQRRPHAGAGRGLRHSDVSPWLIIAIIIIFMLMNRRRRPPVAHAPRRQPLGRRWVERLEQRRRPVRRRRAYRRRRLRGRVWRIRRRA